MLKSIHLLLFLGLLNQVHAQDLSNYDELRLSIAQDSIQFQIPKTPACDSIILIPYRVDSVWGFADTNLKIHIAPKYDWVGPFINGYARARIMNDGIKSYTIIDKKGHEIIEPTSYWSSNVYCDKVIGVSILDKWFLYTIDGKLISNSGFDKVARTLCSNNRIFVGDEHPYLSGYYRDSFADTIIETPKYRWQLQGYFLNLSGDTINETPISEIAVFRDSLAIVENQYDCHSIMNIDGKLISGDDYDYMHGFYNGYAKVYQYEYQANGRRKKVCGVINRKGEVVIPIKYNSVYFSEDAWPMIGKYKINDSCYFNEVYRQKGEIYRSDSLDYWNGYHEGKAEFRHNLKFGYVDLKGKVVIKPEYSWANSFHRGIAYVAKDCRYGFINHYNEVVIPLKYISGWDYAAMTDMGVDFHVDDVLLKFYIDWNGQEYYEENKP